MKYRVLSIAFLAFFLLGQAVSSQSVSAQITGDPGNRRTRGMVYDPHNQVLVMFGGMSSVGGSHALGDTWIYDYATNTWTEHSSSSPPARGAHDMVYCSETNEIIMYGGGTYRDTWSFNCTTQTWSQVITAANPGTHSHHGMAYDPQQNAVILFGGFGSDDLDSDDTWKFDCATREWTELNPTSSPLARYGLVMAYDDTIDHIVLSCGNTASSGHQDDTWTYDFAANTWIEIDTTGNPGSLKWPAMTYDSVNQRCILFGGQVGDDLVDETKIYDAQTETWTNADSDTAPPARIIAALACDPRYGVVIVYGGIGPDHAYLGDTWAYDFSTNTWTDMSTVTDTPTPISTPTNTGTTGTGTTPPPTDITLIITIGVGAGALAFAIIIILMKKRS
ncbi:MAG: Kelch repeat-containing protein [Candidatus Thorarchaeota archaeon]